MGKTGQGCENPFPHLRALLPLFVRATNLMYSLLRAGIEIINTWCGSLTIRFSMCREITATIKSESQREQRERDYCCKSESERERAESRDWACFQRTILYVITAFLSFHCRFPNHVTQSLMPRGYLWNCRNLLYATSRLWVPTPLNLPFTSYHCACCFCCLPFTSYLSACFFCCLFAPYRSESVQRSLQEQPTQSKCYNCSGTSHHLYHV